MAERYPFHVFRSLWDKLGTLIQNGRLISPQQVYLELEKQHDEIYKWAKQRRRIFRELDQEQIVLAQEIVTRFPNLIDPQKETAEADPFVISLAMVETRNLTMLGERCVVVSEEKSRRSGKVKIPDVCNTYGVGHLSALEFFENEGWEF
jgi:hypothetical protein